MVDHSKICWYCGAKDMELKGDYYQCRACGTTWNETPRLGFNPVTIVDALTGGSPRRGRPTEAKPRGASRYGTRYKEN